MEQKFIQITSKDGSEIGIYVLPSKMSQEEFKAEFDKFEEQDDFDNDNTIGAERLYIEEEWII